MAQKRWSKSSLKWSRFGLSIKYDALIKDFIFKRVSPYYKARLFSILLTIEYMPVKKQKTMANPSLIQKY